MKMTPIIAVKSGHQNLQVEPPVFHVPTYLPFFVGICVVVFFFILWKKY